MYKLSPTPAFKKDLRSLDRPIAKRVVEKIEYLAKNPHLAEMVAYLPNNLKGLKKYRVGDWRVLFWVDDTKKEITLYGVEHRGSVYKKLR